MSAREHRFQIIVRCVSHAQLPRHRVIVRDTRAAAVDAAMRELRRIRNTAKHGTDFDTWDLYDIDSGITKRQLLGSGNVYGENPSVSGTGQNHSGAAPY